MKKVRISPLALTVVLLLCLLMALLAGLYALQDSDALGGKDTPETEPAETVYIHLYPPDYDTDIFTLPSFTDKNLYMKYINGGEFFQIREDNKDTFGSFVSFFYGYFDTLRQGDAEALNAMHTDRFFASRPAYESITMQKLYDAEITVYSQVTEGNRTLYRFAVSYRIQRNDGTFRADLKSDAASPQLYTLVDTGSGIFIDDIQDLDPIMQ